ncbi:hypothetical protein ACHAWF_008564, partial [Thalassiosira exigua]
MPTRWLRPILCQRRRPTIPAPSARGIVRGDDDCDIEWGEQCYIDVSCTFHAREEDVGCVGKHACSDLTRWSSRTWRRTRGRTT